MLVGFGLGDDCFCSWAIVFFCLGLLPIALDSSTHFASAFDSASLRLVSRPALPSQLKPPMGDFGSFDDLLLAQPPDVPWLRLRDAAPGLKLLIGWILCKIVAARKLPLAFF
ncbi:hypothetical protein NC652_032138 [Populus alba x Populus x berolinensis]|nr:hypothetical protein NC652_032138 [Populus alba x Populus x berolinensis]